MPSVEREAAVPVHTVWMYGCVYEQVKQSCREVSVFERHQTMNTGELMQGDLEAAG